MRQGWLRLEPDNDRRSHLIKVTEKGLALIHKGYPAWQKAQDEVSRRLGAGQRRGVAVGAQEASRLIFFRGGFFGTMLVYASN